MQIESVVIYINLEKIGYKIGENGVEKIEEKRGRITIYFDDKYRLTYSGLPFSVESKL